MSAARSNACSQVNGRVPLVLLTEITIISIQANAARMEFEPDPAWWQHLFAVIDARDAKGFVNLLTPDAQFRFGNTPTVVGTDAILAGVSSFFASIAACHHRLIRTWRGSNGVACEGEVIYTRHDDSMVTVPFANVLELRGPLISAYRIYIDNSPLTH
jgi:ketosteroid isomerase-like protein